MQEDEFDGLTRLQRRVIDAAADIMEAEADSPEYMHTVLCQVGLPRSQTDGRSFERSNGRASMVVEAGRLWKRGKWVDQPLPYGAKPRLVLVHACSEAVRTQSLEIEIGRSVREFLARLGLDNSGHEYSRFRAQIEALAACRMVLGMSSDTKDVTIATQPFSRFEAWVQHDGKSLGLWPGSLTLSAEFFGSLIDHAVPLDPRGIAALQKSALALDVYSWLAHRLHRIRKPDGVKVSWANMRQQFGQEYKTSKDFKKAFRLALLKVRAVYPDAAIDDFPGGLILKASSNETPKIYA
jgi:Plasmid encoded RepA protein